MKYSCKVCVFFFTVSALSSSLPHSRPTPSWDGRLRRLSPLQAVFGHLPVCSTPPLPTFNAGSKAQSYPNGRGQVRSEGELFMNRELGEILHKYLFFSDVQIHSCSLPWPTCCLCGILPGQQEGSCSSRNTLLPALSVTSKGKGSRTSCS